MLKSHPFGRGGSAWALAWRSVVAERAAGRGICGSAGFEMADGDDLLPGPDLQHEGAAAAADDGIGAVVQQPERRHGATAPQWRIQTRGAERSSAGSSLGRPELTCS
jgi:hypothetical protein